MSCTEFGGGPGLPPSSVECGLQPVRWSCVIGFHTTQPERRVAWDGAATRWSFAARCCTWSRSEGRSPRRSGSQTCRSTPSAGKTALTQGLEPGLSSAERSELVAAKRRSAELETELRATRRDGAGPRSGAPKGGSKRSRWPPSRSSSKLPAEFWTCRPRATTPDGPAHHRPGRSATPDSPTSSSRFTRRPALRVHAVLRLGHGIMAGHNAVALLMRRAGLAWAMRRPK
jgi:hypothetical protein